MVVGQAAMRHVKDYNSERRFPANKPTCLNGVLQEQALATSSRPRPLESTTRCGLMSPSER